MWVCKGGISMIEIKLPEESIKSIRVAITVSIDSFNNAVKSLIKAFQKAEEDRIKKEQLEAIAIDKPPEITEFKEFINKLSNELRGLNTKIETKKELSQSWKYNRYKNKFNPRVPSKKMLHHNCRNNC